MSCSSCSKAARCRRLYFYSCGCRLVRGVEHCALKFGEAIHTALGPAQRGDLDEALDGFARVWGVTQGDDSRNPLRAKTLLREFIRTHTPRTYEIIPPPKTVEIEDRVSPDEIPFVLDLGLEVPIVGRVDAHCQNIHNKQRWVVEYKTGRSLGEFYFQNFLLAPQTFTYPLALQVLTGEPYQGVILEGLQTCKTKAETQAFPIYVGPSSYVDIVRWYQEIYRQIKDCEESGWWPKNLGCCAPYSAFGQPGYVCDYKDLCLVEDWTTAMCLFERRDHEIFKVKKETQP